MGGVNDGLHLRQLHIGVYGEKGTEIANQRQI
jgi:hypothetical protein